MNTNVHAVLHGGRIFTLRTWRDPLGNPALAAFRWQAFIDGQPWRLFKTVKDFRLAARLEGYRGAPRGPHADLADRAEAWSTHLGNQVLDKLAEDHEQRRDPA